MVTATATQKSTASKSRSSSKSASSRSTRSKSASSRGESAITLLEADHAKVKKLFKKFEKLEDTQEKKMLAEQICMELTVHTEVEEEIFYPAVRQKIKDEDLMNEAEVEHASAKDLIAQIQSMEAEDPMYDAKVIVLGEYINHHVEEEEKEMFPKVKKAKMDLEELGERMKMRKQELMQPLAH